MKLPELMMRPVEAKEVPPPPGEAYVIRLEAKNGEQRLASHKKGTVYRFGDVDKAIMAMKAGYGSMFRAGRAKVIPERAWQEEGNVRLQQ